MPFWRSGVEVTAKSDDSPVTAADLAAHHLIVAGLTALDPSIPVLSEEDANIPQTVRAGWQRWWLVDPLDGTKEFVRGGEDYTVNIGLIVDGVPRLGVVFQPAIDRLWGGLVGQGRCGGPGRGNMGPAVGGRGGPRGAFEGQKRGLRLRAGGYGVRAYLCGEGVGGVDHMGDAFCPQVLAQAVHAAEPACAGGQGLGNGRVGAARVGKDGIAALRATGIANIVMMTGDRRPVALRIGQGLGRTKPSDPPRAAPATDRQSPRTPRNAMPRLVRNADNSRADMAK